MGVLLLVGLLRRDGGVKVLYCYFVPLILLYVFGLIGKYRTGEDECLIFFTVCAIVPFINMVVLILALFMILSHLTESAWDKAH